MDVHPTGEFANQAKDYKHIVAVPLSAAMGAEIRDVDVRNLTESAFAEIKDALYRHKMIYFRDQEISHSDQENFTEFFGDFGRDAYTPGLADHPEIQLVLKEADTKAHMIFGSAWHTDSPFLERPPAITILFGKDIPPFGGDTIWANSALAYAFLSDTMKKTLSNIRVHMSARKVFSEMEKGAKKYGKKALGSTPLKFDAEPMIIGATHPVIRTHPETGEKAIYVDDAYSVSIAGMTEPESNMILTFLRNHITQPAFTCRLRWAPHTLAVWDNRLCLHHAFNDHDGYRREMYRTTVLGEVPA
ncbi:MAG: (R)-phenoxypropionate/alpha-ketoglutarate-dioxygenase [Alphaproteobacteria bacterium MarineAlpha11_Bin1]|nr:MAG: (R)-phenoxypropionate/alpha-ketoglutarate-dioxygenase [Alphaproteobacteria bacterium MarineAlpha11_Bin1]|tara:strand:+ start:730 stop:1635 length:906 start_codon:yes stop_codon:yes gene_type:complete